MGTQQLTGDVAHYVQHVHRLRDGDELVLFDPSARVEANACIMHSSTDGLVVDVGEPRAAVNVATREIRWIHALPKGDKADAIVQDATELGATTIEFVHSARSVVKLDRQRALARVARWEKIAQEAARQCGRGDALTIAPVSTWQAAVRGATGTKLCLYEGAIERLTPDAFGDGPLAFAVGPEGGLEPGEVDAARAAGFAPVSLGDFILRTETVCAAVLGAVRVASHQGT